MVQYPEFSFDNSYFDQLEGFYTALSPEPVKEPSLIYWNQALATQLGIDETDEQALAEVFSGNQLPNGAEPIAQVYAGHQFGMFNPQLGDGRALILGELITKDQQRLDLCLKGSGRTPYSRGGDGRAAIGPMLREALVSEALAALGVPTSRALAVVTTGEFVYRDSAQPGAILTRLAASHLRIGTFQYFAAQADKSRLKQLADYTIERHYPSVKDADNCYLALLEAVCEQQAKLIAQWMGLGFIHGVMNTDNMSIAGETIDYGPCAFMESYKPNAVFSSIDYDGRYAYDNQAGIAQWNLSRFAETLLTLVDEKKDRAIIKATKVIEDFGNSYKQYWFEQMSQKLGLLEPGHQEQDRPLIQQWLDLLEAQKVDFTLAWRRLSHAAIGKTDSLTALFSEPAALQSWLKSWQARCNAELNTTAKARSTAMDTINPWLIPRNHHVETALAAAEEGDLTLFNELSRALANPYDENSQYAHLAEPAPASFTQHFQTFCGT